MAQVCCDAVLQYYKELALTFRRTLKTACPCFNARKSHFQRFAVCSDPISHFKLLFCFLHGLENCSFTLRLCDLTYINSYGASKILVFINTFLNSVKSPLLLFPTSYLHLYI